MSVPPIRSRVAPPSLRLPREAIASDRVKRLLDLLAATAIHEPKGRSDG